MISWVKEQADIDYIVRLSLQPDVSKQCRRWSHQKSIYVSGSVLVWCRLSSISVRVFTSDMVEQIIAAVDEHQSVMSGDGYLVQNGSEGSKFGGTVSRKPHLAISNVRDTSEGRNIGSR